MSAIALRRLAGLLLCALLLGLPLGQSRAQIGDPPGGTGYAPRADLIVVYKSIRRMDLMVGSKVLHSYHVALGRNPFGDKLIRGDGRTPEGIYTIDARNERSRFHLSLRISYPVSQNPSARRYVEAADPGGDIFIHGLPNGRDPRDVGHPRDWTDGCIAVTDREMDQIWSMVDTGTLIVIMP